MQVVRVDGEIDIATVALLTGAVADALTLAVTSGGRRMVLDTAEMRFCSVAGMRVLVLAARFCSDHGVLLAFAGLAPRIVHLMATAWPGVRPVVYPDTGTAAVAVGMGPPWRSFRRSPPTLPWPDQPWPDPPSVPPSVPPRPVPGPV